MVLLVALAIILILAVVTAGLFGLARYELHRSKKQLEQDRGVAGMETAVTGLRAQIRNQFWLNASLNVLSLKFDQAVTGAPNERTGFFSQSLTAQLGDGSAGDTLIATQSRPSLLALEDPDDPFRGSLAVVDLLHISANANRLGQDPVKAYDPLPLAAQPVIAVRQIPLSQFTLYSSGDLGIDATLTPDAGRTYALGNISVRNGSVETDFPITSGANIDLAAGGALESRSSPGSAPVSMQVSSTTDQSWPALAKSVNRSTILSGRDLPLGTMSAATMDQLTAATPAATRDLEAQRLQAQCAVAIYERGGRFSGYGGTVSEMPAETGSQIFSIYHTKKYTSGPVIVIDYQKVDAAHSSIYVVSASPYAIVLIRNAATLTSDFSVVTPHAILVAGGLNTTGAFSASLLANGGVYSAPAGWPEP
jgi:hypothetical protein